eukprot:1146537-Pelagomonas_calceolata.AAC.1
MKLPSYCQDQSSWDPSYFALSFQRLKASSPRKENAQSLGPKKGDLENNCERKVQSQQLKHADTDFTYFRTSAWFMKPLRVMHYLVLVSSVDFPGGAKSALECLKGFDTSEFSTRLSVDMDTSLVWLGYRHLLLQLSCPCRQAPLLLQQSCSSRQL